MAASNSETSLLGDHRVAGQAGIEFPVAGAGADTVAVRGAASVGSARLTMSVRTMPAASAMLTMASTTLRAWSRRDIANRVTTLAWAVTT